MGLLYRLRSPKFIPEGVGPLDCIVAGSGSPVVHDLGRYADMVFFGEPGNAFMEAHWLRHAVSSYLEQSQEPTVGGLRIAFKITTDGVSPIPFSAEIPAGGTRIALEYGADGRWVQRNVTTGKAVPLMWPWEVVRAGPSGGSGRFDDLDLAEALFHRRRTA